jgi:hypothetical protein
MYRDSANALDEHDRAVGAILIGEALIDHCDRARGVIDSASTDRNERWRTLAGVQDTYPEIWRHLDRARNVLRGRGANTASYDELRPHVRRGPTNSEGTDLDTDAFDETRRAVEALKLATPGADWAGIRERTSGLIDVPLPRGCTPRSLLIGVGTLFVLVLVAWGVGMIPKPKRNERAEMRRELSEVATQRDARITELRFEVGASCDVERARELTKLLAMAGRMPDARSYGELYLASCGDDAVVDNWAHAPDPHAQSK